MGFRSEGVGGSATNQVDFNHNTQLPPNDTQVNDPALSVRAGDRESDSRFLDHALHEFAAKLRMFALAAVEAQAEPASGQPAGVKDRYVRQAQAIIGYVPGQGHTTDYFEMNRRITSAYAEMYQSNPDVFKWAGMAAFASREVGNGMRQAQALRESGLPWIPFISDISGTEVLQALAQGNLGVYADIYWQHLAYQQGGIEEITRAFRAGELDPIAYEAWQKIDRGRRENNQDLIWEGNTDLLRYEQRTVLQTQVYDPNRRLWQKMSSAPISWFQKINSPIPGDPNNFNSYVDGGDIGSFEDRWRWISESMLPAWRRLDSNRAEALRLLQPLIIRR